MSQSGLSRGIGPLIAVAWDAGEPSLVEAWMADGSLPNLRQLRDQGGYGRLRSSAGLLAGSPWPTFYSGSPPEAHGIYHYLQWSSELSALLRPGPDWLPVRPFWQNLSDFWSPGADHRCPDGTPASATRWRGDLRLVFARPPGTPSLISGRRDAGARRRVRRLSTWR